MLGESFDEGPRRAATLLGTTGRVSFPISTDHPLAQQFFNQGVGQLHGFWYFEAERSFRQVAKIDPDCPMSYYGMALANVNNDSRAKGFLAEATQRIGKASDRERRYIQALEKWYKTDTGVNDNNKERAREYVKALEEILFLFPDDLEAKALLSLLLWEKRSDLGLVSYFAADAMMNEILSVNPFHPVHHYRIHLWDNDKAKIALNSAERCGLSAPGIAHMWHMSGHTFSELDRYFDAAWHQEAAARTDHAYMRRECIFPDQIHNFAHNNEWLIKNLQYIGRVRDAIALARNMIEIPRHPKFNPFPGKKCAHFGRLRLFQIYSHFELWDQLIADAQTQVLGPTSDEDEQVKYFRHLGRAYFRQGDVANGVVQLTLLERRLERVKQDSAAAVDDAVSKAKADGLDEKSIESRRKDATKPFEDKQKKLVSAVDELQGHVSFVAGKYGEALAHFEKAQDVDDTALAEVEYLAGKKEESLKRLRDRVGRRKNQVRPLAALVEMLWRQEKREEARQSFEVLREISGSIDLDVPLFARLNAIAAEFGFGADWRKPKPALANEAELPDLAALGPFTWQPATAADWSLRDGNDQTVSMAHYKGMPVIVIFYLGGGCLHCAEQLQAFASKQAEYRHAGISLIAISTESPKGLKKSQERFAASSEFPFPIVADPDFEVFKRYRAYDDFENVALHATYLIDATGKIRWHDVGAEPFMDVQFLLDEAQRLIYPDRLQISAEHLVRSESPIADALFPQNRAIPASLRTKKSIAESGFTDGL